MRKAPLAGLTLLILLGGIAAVLSTELARDLYRDWKLNRYLSELDGVRRMPDQAVVTPDGIALATDIYLPDRNSGPVPAVLVRLPYGKTRYWEAQHWISRFAPAGFAVVVQDMRGRHGSAGVFAPWPNARDDGVATMDWITAQSWSDGQVAMVGCSALGESQIAVATQTHHALRAIMPIGAGGAIGSAGDLHQYFGTFEGGIPLLAAAFGWFSRHGGKTGDRMAGPEDTDFAGSLQSLPVRGMVGRVRSDPTDFDWLLDNFEDDEAMETAGYVGHSAEFDTPGFLIDDWYDPNVNATLQLARMMDRDGALRHVVIGPGEHCDFGHVFTAGKVGDIPVTGPAIDTSAQLLRFSEHLLMGGPQPDLPKYLVYVMREDKWLRTDAWPPDRAGKQQLFLSGRELTANPASGARQFRSDPMNPVPTIGGAICCTGNPDLRTGPLDQTPVEGRSDLLIYDGAPSDTAVRLAGPVSARLWISADVPDTDLVVRLTDVDPSGTSVTILEGALRLRYRDGFDLPGLMTPGTIYPVEIRMGDIAYLLRPGHRFRVHVAGSSFPRLARNLNGGGDPNTETHPNIAEITVHSGPDTPSRIGFFVLPD